MLRHKLFLSIQYPDRRIKKNISYLQIRCWVQAAIFISMRLTIRFVDIFEGRKLNNIYRKKNYATNVLTFYFTQNTNKKIIQSDIILCTDILIKEAKEQNKLLINHTAHLIIHGVLHAQNFNHRKKSDAMKMENLEVNILKNLGFSNPYI